SQEIEQLAKEIADKYGVNVDLENFNKTDATSDNAGTITGTINLSINGKSDTVAVNKPIDRIINSGGGSGDNSDKNSGRPTEPIKPIEPTKPKGRFIDVDVRDWFYEAVYFADSNDIMKGTDYNRFSPYMNTKRGMIATIIYNLEKRPNVSGTSPFNDVATGSYYGDAVNWAEKNNIVEGFSATNFEPETDITREQLVAILMEYAKFKGYKVDKRENLSNFTDEKEISPWALDAVSWAKYEGLIVGVGYNKLDPKGKATRAQVAAIMKNFVEKFVK
ncbi:MAG: S-layer homology domain-containing protein, partial [Filifactoraceae bacterium]